MNIGTIKRIRNGKRLGELPSKAYFELLAQEGTVYRKAGRAASLMEKLTLDAEKILAYNVKTGEVHIFPSDYVAVHLRADSPVDFVEVEDRTK